MSFPKREFYASDAQAAPKPVETKDDLAKLMLRIDLKIDPKVVGTYYGKVEMGCAAQDLCARDRMQMGRPHWKCSGARALAARA